MRGPFQCKEENRDRDHWRAEDHYQTGRVEGPDEQWKAKPRHSGSAHRMDRYNKVQSGQDGRKAVDKYSKAYSHHIRVRERCAVRGIERPARVHAALHQAPQGERPSDPVNIKAKKIYPRKSEVLRTDHQWNKEISKDRRYSRDKEEEDHHYPVLCE